MPAIAGLERACALAQSRIRGHGNGGPRRRLALGIQRSDRLYQGVTVPVGKSQVGEQDVDLPVGDDSQGFARRRGDVDLRAVAAAARPGTPWRPARRRQRARAIRRGRRRLLVKKLPLCISLVLF